MQEIRVKMELTPEVFRGWLTTYIDRVTEHHYAGNLTETDVIELNRGMYEFRNASWVFRYLIFPGRPKSSVNIISETGPIEIELRWLNYRPREENYSTEVRVRCNEDTALDYFSELLKFIADEWPESQPQFERAKPELFKENTQIVETPETGEQSIETAKQERPTRHWVETPIKVAKALFMIEEEGVTKTLACSTAPVDKKTFNRHYKDDIVRRKKDELKRQFEQWKRRGNSSNVYEFLEEYREI